MGVGATSSSCRQLALSCGGSSTPRSRARHRPVDPPTQTSNQFGARVALRGRTSSRLYGRRGRTQHSWWVGTRAGARSMARRVHARRGLRRGEQAHDDTGGAILAGGCTAGCDREEGEKPAGAAEEVVRDGERTVINRPRGRPGAGTAASAGRTSRRGPAARTVGRWRSVRVGCLAGGSGRAEGTRGPGGERRERDEVSSRRTSAGTGARQTDHLALDERKGGGRVSAERPWAKQGSASRIRTQIQVAAPATKCRPSLIS